MDASAEADFKTSQDNIGAGNYYASVFFCQQAVEKALKALIIELEREVPQTHNLKALGEKAKVPKNFLSALRDLSPEYYITRYPDATESIPADMYDEGIAKSTLDNSKRILEWIKQQIKE